MNQNDTKRKLIMKITDRDMNGEIVSFVRRPPKEFLENSLFY
jgi:hypothetical protein